MNENSKHALLNFVGDIMMGDSFHMLGIGVGSSMLSNKENYIFKKIINVLSQADLNIGNLECTVSSDKVNPTENLKPYLIYSSEHIYKLRNAGFNILTMANNHTMQYGNDIFHYTEHILRENGMFPIGTVNSPYHITDIKGVKLAFLNYSLRPNQFKYQDCQYIEGNRDMILRDINSLSNNVDHVIVLLHWGDEYVNYPNQNQINMAHDFIDAGSTLVIGHHPHVLQGIEYYKEGVIAYSLGNFVFDKPQELQRKSVILQVTLSNTRLNGIKLIPVFINSSYQPEVASGKLQEDINGIIQEASDIIKDRKYNDSEYNNDVVKGLNYMRLQFYLYFIMHFYRYPPKIFLSLFRDAVKRKLPGGVHE